MPSHLVYLCADASASNTITKEFKIKGLSTLTIGKLSQLHVMAKPTVTQFAYGGYRNNIEAFVAATLYKKKTLTNQEAYPLPRDYTPTVPLPLPQVICKFKPALTDAQLRKILEGWSKNGMGEIDVGKGGPAYEILEPSWRIAFTGLPQLALPQCARVDKRAQVEDLLLLRPIYQFIDGFLATNTYPYKKEDYKDYESGLEARDYLGRRMEMRNCDDTYRVGYGDGKLQKVEFGATFTVPRMVSKDETNDLTPYIDSTRSIGNTVFVAKPSPLPSSTSWGSPSSVPNLGGLVFPYFPGMLLYDLPGSRDLIGRLIFRCLGDDEVNPKDAYKNLRQKLGSTLNTPQGLILGHVLKGIELSLDSQSQLFLLFDEKMYLGFCLLGLEFSIWAHGLWREARSPEELREDLKEITTPSQSLEELLVLLKGLSTGIETSFLEDLTKSKIETSGAILGILGQLERVGKIEDGTRAKIVSLLGRCNLPDKFKPITPENITWAIEELTLRSDFPFDEDIPIFVPATQWEDSDCKTYKVLASFGPRSFSLRNQTGDEIELLADKDSRAKKYVFIQVSEKSKETHPLIVYTKAIRECVKDWNAVMETRRVRMDFTERAGGIRGNKFWGADKGRVLKAFSDAINKGLLTGKVKPTTGEKRKRSDEDEVPISNDILEGLL